MGTFYLPTKSAPADQRQRTQDGGAHPLTSGQRPDSPQDQRAGASAKAGRHSRTP